MAWKNHQESGESVRSIRDWFFCKIDDRDDGGIQILYGDRADSENYKHGHYGENADGVMVPESRAPKTRD